MCVRAHTHALRACVRALERLHRLDILQVSRSLQCVLKVTDKENLYVRD
jgi:hypothetical protein